MSTRASNSQFQAGEGAFSPREDPSPKLLFQGVEHVNMEARMARKPPSEAQGPLSWGKDLGLGHAPANHLVGNPFLRRTQVAPPFEVPPSPAYLEELNSCWPNPKAFAHHGRDARTLASMCNVGEHGLDHMAWITCLLWTSVLPR